MHYVCTPVTPRFAASPKIKLVRVLSSILILSFLLRYSFAGQVHPARHALRSFSEASLFTPIILVIASVAKQSKGVRDTWIASAPCASQ